MAAEEQEQPPKGQRADEHFDVFLSHNSDDKPLVRDLAERLEQRGVRVWLDEKQLIPGRPWQEELERILTTCKSAAVLVGPSGLGSWQARETRLSLAEFVNRGLPVIPVLLPGATSQPELPAFLRQFTWVEFRQGMQGEQLDRLVWGITGRKGDRPPNAEVHSSPREPDTTLTSRVVITLHGIRTRGAWQKTLGDALRQAGFVTESLDFGYFTAIQLLLPSARRRKVLWFRDQYTAIRDRHAGATPSIVAHSLGTYLVTQAMTIFFGDVKFDRIILCGSIARRDYKWSKAKKGDLFQRGLNDYGRQDVWSRLVEWVVSDAGSSGHRGFSDNAKGALLQQERDFRHSDYFYAENYKLRWIPFLLGQKLSTLPVVRRTDVNWKFLATTATLALLATFALWFFCADMLLWTGTNTARDARRHQFSIDSLWNIDSVYTSEVRGHGLSPSQCKNIVERSFRITDLAHHAVGTVPFYSVMALGKPLPNMRSAQAAIVTAIAEGAPQVLLTGRIGSGLGYVWAHLFASIATDAAREPGPLRIAGRERWVFRIGTKEMDGDQGEARTTLGIARMLLQRLEAPEMNTERDMNSILRHAIILVMIEPCQHLHDSFTALLRFGKDTHSCLIAAPSIDMLSMWDAHNLREGHLLCMMQYPEDAAAQEIVAMAAVRQFAGLGEELVGPTARRLLQDPFGHDFATYNWRIAKPYVPEWVRVADPATRVEPPSDAQSRMAAEAGLKNAIRKFAGDWLAGFLRGGSPKPSIAHDFSGQIDADTLTLLLENVLRAAGQRAINDGDVDAMIATTLRRVPELTDRLAAVTPVLRCYLAGSPFFRFNAKDELSWIPFSVHASRLLQ